MSHAASKYFDILKGMFWGIFSYSHRQEIICYLPFAALLVAWVIGPLQRLNMELDLQSLFGLLCTAKIDDIS
jgi:hypothetical protein